MWGGEEEIAEVWGSLGGWCQLGSEGTLEFQETQGRGLWDKGSCLGDPVIVARKVRSFLVSVCLFSFFSDTRSHCVAQASPELTEILLLQPLGCWGYRPMPPCPAFLIFMVC